MSKKAGEPIDGLPFITGAITLLKQFHSSSTDQFFAYVGQYVRSLVDSSER